MITKILVLSILLNGVYSYLDDQCDLIENILKRHGYAYELHNVLTEDKFNLGVFRITGKIGSEIEENKPAIVMQHGINASPNSFVSNGKSSIAFYFADRGFDVWMPSARGTYYSRKNDNLSPDDKKYWDYSFEDLGMKDTKAYLEYIYNIKKKKVFYLGFSQGFMQIMAAFSLDPEFFRERLEKIVGWGPVTRVDLSTNVWLAFISYIKLWPLITLDNILGIVHTPVFTKEACMSSYRSCSYFRPFCRFKTMFNAEFRPYNNNPYYASGKDASSVKCLQHIIYNLYEGGFFRFPSNESEERVPYDLKQITIPLGLFVGENDMLAPPANAKWLAEVFEDHKNFTLFGTYEYLGHFTFVAGYTQFQHYTDTYNFLMS